MPWTVACGLKYASTLSRHGIEIPVVVWVASSTHPTRYSGAHEVLSQRPSIDASLSGCSLVTSIAMLGPMSPKFAVANRMKPASATFMFAFASSRCRFLSRYQALTLIISAAPAVHDAMNTWSSRGMNDGVNTTCPKSVMTARVGAGSVTIS